VTYRLFRPDWFVLSGEEGPRKFYMRLAQGPAGIRGYVFRYPIAEAAALDRVMIAIANSFEPFPGTDIAANPARAPSAAPQPAAPTSTSAPATTIAARPAATAAPAAAGEGGLAITAVSLGAGRAFTSAAAWDMCAEARFRGAAVSAQGAGPAPGTIALAVVGATAPAAALAREPSAGGLFALSFEPGAAGGVTVGPALWRDGSEGPRVSAALQRGAAGAAIADAQGRIVALVQAAPPQRRLVAGVAPVADYAVTPLSAATPAGQVTGGGLPAAAAALLALDCVPRR
jgi:hypothetical protein